ncbi:hypothetical protein PRIPAC_81654 [Pristionchus pacificus]|uniref:F-box domain-containing protein n=1 Tax=Pristionchus pacificus TaxID=54126 RepID=A0A2A6C364_PRIPA|nr:hypothetical protein PRIPAC_81654 [Pristionchus pacificus]|eukprot:PDM72559.1 hypothetical protein PRIPAC_38993 [Pristionchus pacificus]
MNVLSRFIHSFRVEKGPSPLETLPAIPLMKILSYLDENDFFHLKATSSRLWKAIEETKMTIPRRTIEYLCVNTKSAELKRFSHSICVIRAHAGKKTVEWILTHSKLITIRRTANKNKRKSRLILTVDERDFDLLLNRIVNNSMVLGVDLKRDDLQFVLEYDNEIVDTKRVNQIIENAELRTMG